jgi:putative oxidoreductase
LDQGEADLTLLGVFAYVDCKPILPRVQRLFSTFPNAWPGFGLLILRLAAGIALVGAAFGEDAHGDFLSLLFRCVAVALAALLALGFGTPFAAAAAAAIQVGIMVLDHEYRSPALVAAALGVGLAVLGPGAWSLDARIFGRKRLV